MSFLEGVGENRADDPAGDRDQDGIIARLDPSVTARSASQVVVARVGNHPVVHRVALVETLATLPPVTLVAVVLDVAVLDHLPLLDLLVAAERLLEATGEAVTLCPTFGQDTDG